MPPTVRPPLSGASKPSNSSTRSRDSRTASERPKSWRAMLVRAKRSLDDDRVPFELPPRAQLGERLAAALEVVNLIFNEGCAATSGNDRMRPALCDEALRLARMLSALASAADPARPATRAPRAPKTPTGTRSARCTTRCSRRDPHRWSNSTRGGDQPRPGPGGGAAARAGADLTAATRAMPTAAQRDGRLAGTPGRHDEAHKMWRRDRLEPHRARTRAAACPCSPHAT